MDIFHIWKLTGITLILSVGPAVAESYSCAGTDPDWDMEITDDSATFSFVAAQTLDIPHRTTAQGRDWPKALTVLGGRDTAIVILNNRLCSTPEITNYPIEINILTQKAETPVILTGCCTIP